MAANDIRINQNVFVDGKGHAGETESFNAPVLAQKVEEFRAGGMNVPIDLVMGQEKMEADFSLYKYSKDVLALWGVRQNASTPFVVREALKSLDGTITPVEHTMRGIIREMDPGQSKAGEIAPIKFTLSLTYYRLKHGNTVVQEIDGPNMIHMVNGVDILAAERAALGR